MKSNIIFNKKAQVFMPLFVIVTLIIFTTLYLDLAAKTEQFEQQDNTEDPKIGTKQLVVLQAALDAQKAQLYLDLAATYAYGNAAAATAREGYLSADECRQYRGVPIVYGNDENPDCMLYNEDLEEQLAETVTTTFNDALTPYLEAYEETLDIPQYNYIISFDRGNPSGIEEREEKNYEVGCWKTGLFCLIPISGINCGCFSDGGMRFHIPGDKPKDQHYFCATRCNGLPEKYCDSHYSCSSPYTQEVFQYCT